MSDASPTDAPGGSTRDPTIAYYAARASEYEAIYERPERRDELAALVVRVASLLSGRHVLEVACGTGWWTRRIAPPARRVTATDATPEVLALARSRLPPGAPVELMRADAYALQGTGDGFEGALAAFWWSHVPRARLAGFVDGLHARLAPEARVVLIDNRWVPGVSTPISRTDAAGDAWQARRLADGSRHEVVKNFPSPDALRASLGAAGALGIEVEETRHFWLATYRAPGRPPA